MPQVQLGRHAVGLPFGDQGESLPIHVRRFRLLEESKVWGREAAPKTAYFFLYQGAPRFFKYTPTWPNEKVPFDVQPHPICFQTLRRKPAKAATLFTVSL